MNEHHDTRPTLEKLEAADPFIEIGDRLRPAVRTLKIAAFALANPEFAKHGEVKDLVHLLEDVTLEIEAIQERADGIADEIWRQFRVQ